MTRKIFLGFILVVTFLALGTAETAYSVTITFEGKSGLIFNSGEFLDVEEFRFTLTNVNGGFLNITSQSNIVETGTTKLFAANHSIVTLTRIDGQAFDLLSFDIGGSFDFAPNRWAD